MSVIKAAIAQFADFMAFNRCYHVGNSYVDALDTGFDHNLRLEKQYRDPTVLLDYIQSHLAARYEGHKKVGIKYGPTANLSYKKGVLVGITGIPTYLPSDEQFGTLYDLSLIKGSLGSLYTGCKVVQTAYHKITFNYYGGGLLSVHSASITCP